MQKFLKAQGFNVVLVIGVIYFLAQRLPGIMELYRLEGQVAATSQVTDLSSGNPINLPLQKRKFWFLGNLVWAVQSRVGSNQ